MSILDFPMNQRMYSIWYARSIGRLTTKWKIKSNSIELEEIMDAISEQFKDDAKEWTADEVDELVDSFFENIEVMIIKRNPLKKPERKNDNDSE